MRQYKILIFEYIIGGGFNQAELPESLAKEGLLMLQALVDNFARLDSMTVTLLLDQRMIGRIMIPKSFVIHVISEQHDCLHEFSTLIAKNDAVWPIAPETGGILQALCLEVEQSGKILLNTSADAVSLAGDKWLAYELFKQNSIPTIKTYKLNKFSFSLGEWLIKPRDGVGCEHSFVVDNPQGFMEIIATLNQELFIIQPHIQGKKTSMCCLFNQGLGWLLCVNEQHFTFANNQYHLDKIVVNIPVNLLKYRELVDSLALALPQLWGYVGIDLIETNDQIYVLEINPRLTSSFAGIYDATGINCVASVLELTYGEPTLLRLRNQTISVTFN